MEKKKKVNSRRLITYRTTAVSVFFYPQSDAQGSMGSFQFRKKNSQCYLGLGKLL